MTKRGQGTSSRLSRILLFAKIPWIESDSTKTRRAAGEKLIL